MIELLETRRLFAVTVKEGYPGFYEVTGDGADDVICISVDQGAGTISLDGVVYANAAYVNVYGNGGNDTIKIVGPGGGPIAASIKGGDGNDVLVLDHVSGAAWGGAGDDRIELTDSYRGQAYGDDGADRVVINGACTDAEVRGGEGNDTLDGTASTVAVVLYGEGGWDRLYGSPFDDILDGGLDRDYLFGRDGDDQFYTRDGDGDYIIGGAGIDTAVCDSGEINTSGTEILITG